jgi:hypothetical protein
MSNLSIFKPELWSKAIMKNLDVITSMRKHSDYSFNSEIKYGTKLHITKLGDTQIRNYVQGTDITFDNVDGDEVILEINQQRYFGKEYDDIDKVQAIPGAVEADMKETAKALALDADEFVSATLYKAVADGKISASATAITPNKGNVVDAIEDGLVKLYERNVSPAETLNGEFSPKMYSELRKYLTELNTNNPELIKRGAVGRYNMVDVFIENRLPVASKVRYNFIRTNKALAYAEQIEKVQAISKEKGFATLFKGLMVYGAVVARAEEAYAIKETVDGADSAWLTRV